MFAIVGTVPKANFPLVFGPVTLKDEEILIEGRSVSVNRGTTALLAAAARTTEVLGLEPPWAYLAGDIGLGDGSRLLYAHLTENLGQTAFSTLTFHYLQPDVDWHNRVLFAVEEMKQRPILIADAGFMYAAKMGGQAGSYDLFTPDIGELAFLADEEAPHPFYTRGFILHEEAKVPELISRAYDHDNAARYLLVKGNVDLLADQNGILGAVDYPKEEALEAIGGTGDTLTGLVTSLIASGLPMDQAALAASRANRLAGQLSRPTPATSIKDIIRHIPTALKEVLFL